MHVLHVFHAFRVGGSESRTARIIRGLGREFRHTIVSLDGDFAARALLRPDDDVSFTHADGFAGRSFFGNAADARRWLKRIAPDLLIAYGWGGFEWIVGNSIVKVCPDIFSMEGFLDDEAEAEIPRRRLFRSLFGRQCTRVHACSLALRERAVDGWRLPESKVAYIPNGIDASRFEPHRRATPSGPLVLGIVATLSLVKNHALLLDACRRVGPLSFELRIVGDGPERRVLEEQAASSGLNARFLGHLPDPAPELRQFDVFCLSSRSEQMPMCVLEAMAAGLPVVSTDVGDVRAMVGSENRQFIVRPGDPEAYAEALRRLAADPTLRQRLGASNRARCLEEYAESLMVARHRELYLSCRRGGAADRAGRQNGR